jgi:hypothetical protein
LKNQPADFRGIYQQATPLALLANCQFEIFILSAIETVATVITAVGVGVGVAVTTPSGKN